MAWPLRCLSRLPGGALPGCCRPPRTGAGSKDEIGLVRERLVGVLCIHPDSDRDSYGEGSAAPGSPKQLRLPWRLQRSQTAQEHPPCNASGKKESFSMLWPDMASPHCIARHFGTERQLQTASPSPCYPCLARLCAGLHSVQQPSALASQHDSLASRSPILPKRCFNRSRKLALLVAAFHGRSLPLSTAERPLPNLERQKTTCRHARSALRVEIRGGGFASFMDGSVVHWPAHAGMLDITAIKSAGHAIHRCELDDIGVPAHGNLGPSGGVAEAESGAK